MTSDAGDRGERARRERRGLGIPVWCGAGATTTGLTLNRTTSAVREKSHTWARG